LLPCGAAHAVHQPTIITTIAGRGPPQTLVSILEESVTEDKYKQSNDELMSQLEEQIKFIISSSKSFDEGNEAEAKRLANHLRTLLYDTIVFRINQYNATNFI